MFFYKCVLDLYFAFHSKSGCTTYFFLKRQNLYILLSNNLLLSGVCSRVWCDRENKVPLVKYYPESIVLRSFHKFEGGKYYPSFPGPAVLLTTSLHVRFILFTWCCRSATFRCQSASRTKFLFDAILILL